MEGVQERDPCGKFKQPGGILTGADRLPDPGTGSVPDEVYDSWAGEIRMEEFSAEEWVDLAIAGGFKYIVVIAKHHDGFHMWDTEYSDYKITNAPMGRDYIRELTDACHEKGMPIGLYYSQRDWHQPDYEPLDTECAVRTPQPPFFEIKEGCVRQAGRTHKKYIEYMHNTVLELMEKYGKIDVLWWDASWYLGMFTEEMWDSFELEEKVREKQPHILINNRASLPGDFDTPECRIGHVQRERAWETCMPMGNQWAWTGNGLKSFKTIISQLVNTVCGDGNYLLSIGCMPSGKIAPEETECMLKLGAWMKQYGEAVYNTRSGPWNPGVFGGAVYRGDTVYVHIVNRPGNGVLRLPLGENRIREIECLTGEAVEAGTAENCLILKVPDVEADDIILKIRMEETVCVSVRGIDVQESECAGKEEFYSPFMLKKDE